MRRTKWLAGVALAAPLLAAPALAPAAAAKDAPGGSGKAVATVGSRTITVEELDKKVDSGAINAYYNARKTALDLLIADYLFEDEAKARGITKEKLVETEITNKTKVASDEEIQKFFDENKERMSGQTLEQMKPRIKSYLESEVSKNARQTFIDSLRAKAGVKVMLDPPRMPVKIAADDPAKGPATAPVQIVEFSDFQ